MKASKRITYLMVAIFTLATVSIIWANSHELSSSSLMFGFDREGEVFTKANPSANNN